MFPIFSFLWAAAVLFHQTFHIRLEQPLDVVLNLAAVWALLRPGSLARFTTLVVVHLANVAWLMPVVVNHWLIMAFGDLAILVALGRLLLRRRGARGGEELVRGLAPSMRLMLVLVYVFATLPKINPDFLDPAVSCGVDHLLGLAGKIPLVPAGELAGLVSIWGTIAIEAGLPVLMLLPRTRTAAVVVGTLFHLVLGLNGYHDFSAAILPFYLLLCPDDLPRRLGRLRERAPLLDRGARRAARVAAHPAAVIVAAALCLAATRLPSALGEHDLYVVVHTTTHGVWLVYELALLALLIGAVRRPREAPAAPTSFRPRGAGDVVVLALFLVNAASPYVGLKTEHSFCMFSNLRTEADEWNHLLVPESVRVFSFQDELVTPLASSDDWLAEAAKKRYRLVWFEFRRYLLERPDTAVTYEFRGARRSVARAGDDPRLSRPLHPVLRKLFWFRTLPPPGENRCLH